MPIIHHAYRKEESELGRADAAAGAVKHSFAFVAFVRRMLQNKLFLFASPLPAPLKMNRENSMYIGPVRDCLFPMEHSVKLQL